MIAEYIHLNHPVPSTVVATSRLAHLAIVDAQIQPLARVAAVRVGCVAVLLHSFTVHSAVVRALDGRRARTASWGACGVLVSRIAALLSASATHLSGTCLALEWCDDTSREREHQQREQQDLHFHGDCNIA